MTALHSALPAAGWYTDPAIPTRYRWWSGVDWTEHVSDPHPPAPWLTHGVQPALAPVGSYGWEFEARARG